MYSFLCKLGRHSNPHNNISPGMSNSPGRSPGRSPGHSPRGAGRRLSAVMAVTVIAVALAPAISGTLLPGRAVTASADEITASASNLRTGWDRNEPALAPSVVGGGTFGQLFSTSVYGQVYAQPLVVGSTVIVATENDRVYGLNAVTGAIIWKMRLGKPHAMTTCGDLVPNIGVTSTPVYDAANGTVYVMALVQGTSLAYHLFGINPQTGAITFQARIGGHPANDPNITFRAYYENQRPGLLLRNGSVYAAFASYCDHKPYAGYVAGVNVSTGAKTLWTDESGVTNDQAGIWHSGGGLMSDGSGRIFFSSGNGVSPPPGPGTKPPGQLAESTVRLAVQSNGSLAARDFFSPGNAPTLDSSDTDFGSGAPVGLPYGTTTYPHVLVQAGKDGRVFLLNRDNLGGREQGTGGGNADLSKSGPYTGQWGHPAVFEASTAALPPSSSGLDDYVYYLGKKDYLRVLQVSADSSGTPVLTGVANSTLTFGFSSGSPAVTSNGTDPASAVVWVVNSPGGTGAGATLDAFSAVPGAGCTVTAPCAIAPIWSAPIGTASKFSIPATSSGVVYVGTRDGNVLGFGTTTAAPLAGAVPATFGETAVGSTATRHVTVTAVKPVTVTGVAVDSATAPAPFAAGTVTETAPGSSHSVPVTFPVTLSPGDTLQAPVTFTPSAPGGTTGSLEFASSGTGVPPARVPLSGDGTRTGLYAATDSLSFALVLDDGTVQTAVPAGIPVPLTTDIVNGGSAPETVISVSGPSGPFTAADLPKPGTVLQPGQAVVVQVTYTPEQAGTDSSSFTITGNSGTSVTVSLSGTATAPVSEFTVSPTAVSFGTVHLRHTATRWIHITNAGNQRATTAGAPPPAAPFGAPYRVAKGLSLNGGDDLMIPVTFTPVTTGTFAGAYRLTWTDSFGTHTVNVPLTGTGGA